MHFVGCRLTPAPRTPKFVLVREALWENAPLLPRPVLDRAAGSTGRDGVKLRDWYGPWHFHAGFREGRLALHVHANLAKRAVERLGRRRVGRRSKTTVR